jgi:hypothetical protein
MMGKKLECYGKTFLYTGLHHPRLSYFCFSHYLHLNVTARWNFTSFLKKRARQKFQCPTSYFFNPFTLDNHIAFHYNWFMNAKCFSYSVLTLFSPFPIITFFGIWGTG